MRAHYGLAYRASCIWVENAINSVLDVNRYLLIGGITFERVLVTG